MYKVFVYGTLKQGHGNHRVFPSDRRLIGEGSVEGKMVSLGAFPGVLKDTEGVAHGELYEVVDMDSLDCLEGNGSFYTREVKPVTMDDGEEVDAWVYFLPESEYGYLPLVERGVW